MEFFEDISGRWEDYYNFDTNELMFLYNIHKRTHIRLEGYLKRIIEEKCNSLGYDVFVEFTYDRLFITTYAKKLKKEDVEQLCECFDLIFECLTFECITYSLNNENNFKQSLTDGNREYRHVFEFKRYLEEDWLKKLKEVDNKYLK